MVVCAPGESGRHHHRRRSGNSDSDAPNRRFWAPSSRSCPAGRLHRRPAAIRAARTSCGSSRTRPGWRSRRLGTSRPTGRSSPRRSTATRDWHEVHSHARDRAAGTPRTTAPIPNLYYGTNLLDEVPQDLYQQDWWYRTTFDAPAGHSTYQLNFPGINYRAEIWLNGHLVADAKQIVGMYVDHDLDVTPWIKPGRPEHAGGQGHSRTGAAGHRRRRVGRQLVRLDQLELPGLPGARARIPANGNSFVADRNAGIWKPVYLRMSGDGGDRRLDRQHRTCRCRTPTRARLTIYSDLRNFSQRSCPRGPARHHHASGQAGRPGRAAASPSGPAKQREISFSANGFRAADARTTPTCGGRTRWATPNLYDLHLEFRQFDQADRRDAASASASAPSPKAATTTSASPSSARAATSTCRSTAANFLVRGATYTPDLLYRVRPRPRGRDPRLRRATSA